MYLEPRCSLCVDHTPPRRPCNHTGARMSRPFRRILAGTIVTASLIAAVPAAQAATHAQPDPNEPIICIRCGVLSPIQLPGWVVNPPIKQIETGPVVHP